MTEKLKPSHLKYKIMQSLGRTAESGRGALDLKSRGFFFFFSFPESRTLGKCFLNVWQFLTILVCPQGRSQDFSRGGHSV